MIFFLSLIVFLFFTKTFIPLNQFLNINETYIFNFKFTPSLYEKELSLLWERKKFKI